MIKCTRARIILNRVVNAFRSTQISKQWTSIHGGDRSIYPNVSNKIPEKCFPAIGNYSFLSSNRVSFGESHLIGDAECLSSWINSIVVHWTNSFDKGSVSVSKIFNIFTKSVRLFRRQVGFIEVGNGCCKMCLLN